MPKVSPRLRLALLASITVVGFDVLVISGWAMSCICLLWGVYLSIKFFHGPKKGDDGFRAIVCLVAFGLTGIVGYSLAAYVESDLAQFGSGINHIPANKSELLKMGDKQLSWFSRWSVLTYANVDGVAVAKIRSFPYKIVEYDFNRRTFHSRTYD